MFCSLKFFDVKKTFQTLNKTFFRQNFVIFFEIFVRFLRIKIHVICDISSHCCHNLIDFDLDSGPNRYFLAAAFCGCYVPWLPPFFLCEIFSGFGRVLPCWLFFSNVFGFPFFGVDLDSDLLILRIVRLSKIVFLVNAFQVKQIAYVTSMPYDRFLTRFR